MKASMMIIIVALFLQITAVALMWALGFIHFHNETFTFGALKLFFQNFPGVLFGDREQYVLLRAYASKAGGDVASDLFKLFMYSSPFLIIMILVSFRYLNKKTTGFGKSEFIRGAKLIEEEEQIARTKKIEHNFKLGAIPIPKSVETSHLMVIGSAGAGKTQILKPNIKLAVENLKFKNIINDIKGDWTSELFNQRRGDLIFNPMDSRSLRWTVFNDIKDVMDLKNVCLWLIPEQPGKDPFWQNSARMILESIMLYLWQNEKTKNEDIKNMLNLSAEDLAKTLDGYGKGAEFAEKKDSFLTLQAQMAFIDFLDDGDFSIREWINKEEGGTIFLLNSEKTDAIMRPVLSLFVNFTASEILSLPDDLTRRIYFWLDEFTSLQKLQKVIDLLKLGRSKGCMVTLAFQDFQQLEKIYSKEDMRTVINNTASIAVLQLKEPTAAKFFADRFGKQERRIKSGTTSMGVQNNRDGISLATQIRDDCIVKDSEILTMLSLTSYVMIKDIEGVTKTKISVLSLPVINSTFMQRSMTKEAQVALLKRQQAAATVQQLSVGEEETQDINELVESKVVVVENSDFEDREF
jgi:type IV secretory pathway TraG/TraD family ATPase VirD4